MLKANKLFAMAAKLEEEGVITPNTEVEVSASVSVTPEEQEKIDEALTEVEEIATAEQELDESVEEVEDLEEAEATLSAIRDAIKREGIVTPQMYAFLQDAGYLEVIASFQKNVTYPASEAIANVSLNKQYADTIIAGCEAGIFAAQEGIKESIQNFSKKVIATFEKWKIGFDKDERKILAYHNTLKASAAKGDLKNTVYSASFPSFEQMKKFNDAADKLVAGLKEYNSKRKNIFDKVEMGDKGKYETISTNVKVFKEYAETVKDIFSEAHKVKNRVSGGKWNVADAGFTYENLKNEAFKYTLNIKKTIELIDKYYVDFWALSVENISKDHPIAKWFMNVSMASRSAVNTYISHAKLIYRGYIAACTQAIKLNQSEDPEKLHI